MSNSPTVIGILCMDKAEKLHEKFKTSTSYISLNYCKIFERASARMVPIWLGRDESYYRSIMCCVNGIVLPGGAVFFDSSDITSPEQTNNYVLASKFVQQIAREMNDSGIYFPLFGICLGFQFLLNHSASADVRVPCERLTEDLNIVLEKGFQTSKMFQNLPDELQTIMETTKCAPHSHMYCITKEQLKMHAIEDQWRVTAINRDRRGLELISAVEHTKYPFYGTQFHPERCVMDDERYSCVEYLVVFFIAECRKNTNAFQSEADMSRHLIANFMLTKTGLDEVPLQECFIFGEDTDYLTLNC